MNDQTREAARQHVLACIEQIMPITTFRSLVNSIPEHPGHFRDRHPIRMVYETVRSRRDVGELRQYVMTRAQDWERLVIAWAFQRLLYEISRCDSEAGFCESVGGHMERIPHYGVTALCLAGLMRLSGEWYGDPDDELSSDAPPPEKYLGDADPAGPQPLT